MTRHSDDMLEKAFQKHPLSKDNASSRGNRFLVPLGTYEVMNESQNKNEVADIVTSLQEEVKTQSEMLYTFIGALQRDAPPSSLSGEAVLEPAERTDVFTQVMGMPAQLISQSHTIKHLVDLLPDGASEEDDLDEIVKLQQESNELDAQLEKALVQSEDTLLKAQALFDLLGKHKIHIAALQQASAATEQSQSEV